MEEDDEIQNNIPLRKANPLNTTGILKKCDEKLSSVKKKVQYQDVDLSKKKLNHFLANTSLEQLIQKNSFKDFSSTDN
jgi:hypothetical protein